MDWGIEDIDHSSVDSFAEKGKGLVNSASYINLVDFESSDSYLKDIQESKGFTSAFENLKVDTGTRHQFAGIPIPKKDATTSSNKCKNEETIHICGFKTHEKSSLQLIIQGPEILNYQGTRHSADDVAPYWKKDSRMWLWKSVRYVRRKNKMKCSAIRPKNRQEDFK